jgi:hypothetical protein
MTKKLRNQPYAPKVGAKRKRKKKQNYLMSLSKGNKL